MKMCFQKTLADNYPTEISIYATTPAAQRLILEVLVMYAYMQASIILYRFKHMHVCKSYIRIMLSLAIAYADSKGACLKFKHDPN